MNRSLVTTPSFIIALGYLASACGSGASDGGGGGGPDTGGAFNGGGFNGGGFNGGGFNGGGFNGGGFNGGGFNAGAGGSGFGGAVPGGGGAVPGGGGTAPGGGGTAPGGGGTAPGAGGAGVGGDTGYKPPCITAATQVVIIGDSYVTGFLSPPMQAALATLVPQAAQYRNYAVAGVSMISGGILGAVKVPAQFDQAVAAGPDIKLSIMDGGGNDILICDQGAHPACNTLCAAAGSASQKVCTDIVTAALDGATALMTHAADKGVKDVIYFFYPHIPAQNGGYTEILDYASPKARALCDGAAATTGGKLHCHFVDLIEPFKAAGGDRNAANFVADGIHPSAAGQAIIAKQISDVMTNNCLGQASGCCAP